MQQCFDTCYDKYLWAINSVSQTIREIAYENNSLIGYKGFPEHNIRVMMNSAQGMTRHLPEFNFAMQN
jgi:hypothetical protein